MGEYTIVHTRGFATERERERDEGVCCRGESGNVFSECGKVGNRKVGVLGLFLCGYSPLKDRTLEGLDGAEKLEKNCRDVAKG